MAKKVWDTPIAYNSDIDWAGDASTGDLPLSGSVVQQYIKDNFGHKAGYFHSDETAGKCYVFASREVYLTWKEDGEPDNDERILGVFGITTNFAMSVSTNEAAKSASAGSTGNTISFTWNVKDLRDGSFTTEDANCVLTFSNGSIVKSTTFRISATDHTFTQNIDDYLITGTNNIDITVTGLTSKVSGSIRIVYTIVSLGLTSSYRIGQVYDIKDTLHIPYRIAASGNTYTEWWWDGIKLNTVDQYYPAAGVADRQKDVILDNLSNYGYGLSAVSGLHSLMLRSYVLSNGQPFYTDTLYFDIIINNVGYELTEPVFPIKTVIPETSFDERNTTLPIKLYGLSQYIPYNFTLSTYYPDDSAYLETDIVIDKMPTKYSELVPKGEEVTIQIIPTISGDTTMTISSGEVSRVINFTIGENELGLNELTEADGLVLNFSADGRTNTSVNKDSWNYNGYTATFDGFYWTSTSGWNNGRLLIGENTSLTLDNFLPFASDISARGAALELEYSTNNVTDDNAIICDTLNESGIGIQLTATEAKLKTASQTLSVKYKSGENVRIAFVVEPKAATNTALILVYMNGIISGAVEWASADSLLNTVPIKFVGSEGASISLKQIRGYGRSLSGDQIINNYILYRDTFAEMQTVFSRNNIYLNGQISPDALAKTIPVMLITGDIPVLDKETAATKSDIVLMEEVKYIDYLYNRSFVYRNAPMSCQGTSTLTYPKKNYRLYTEEKKLANDITWPLGATWTYDPDHSNFFRMDVNDLDNEANWIEQPWVGKKDGKHKVWYSFRDNGDYENGEPQETCRWTIKADFPESSSTHNLNVARLWNMIMYNASLGANNYPLRTRAQQCALQENYGYDVRTAIDGIPIVMFYRATSSDPYSFMGKYNFNNDKKNEEVFGFTGITSFDDGTIDPTTLRNGKHVQMQFYDEDGVFQDRNCSKYSDTMQCWELLDSANPISLFMRTDYNLADLTTEDMGFEARYPDDAGTDECDKRWRAFVQPFYEWMVGIRDECVIERNAKGEITNWVNPARFTEEKYQWLDVPKMAAYYDYLIRFGAVDQVVKNAMFTSEDGQHWYYILYDNDTIFGLSNLGNLEYGPYITRNTKSSGANDYDYAARESTLWNCLEADQEFMESVVPEIDESLRLAGLVYDNVIKTFDTDAGDMWCETVYNKDSEYKYIDSYRNGVNYLNSMQGARKTHRKWWVSRRFDYYDGKYHNGTYLGKYFLINTPGAVSPKNKFKIVAGTDGYYGTYADGYYENRTELKAGESAIMNFEENVQIGRNYRILNPHNLYEVDLTICSQYLRKLEANQAYDEVLGSKLKRLILGSDYSDVNDLLTTNEFKGVGELKYLEELNVQNYRALTSISGLDQLQYLRTLDARGSGLVTVSFAKGAPIEQLSLPESMQIISLEELPLLKTSGIYMESYDKLNTLTINDCENLKNSWNWVSKFNNLRYIDLEVEWGKENPIKWDELKAFLTGKSGTLKGTIYLSKDNLPSDIIEELFDGEFSSWFGKDCLNPTNRIYVSLPQNVYLKLSRSTIIEGLDTDEGKTELSLFYVGYDATPNVTIAFGGANNAGMNYDKNTGVITANEVFTQDTTITVYALVMGMSPSQIELFVKNKIYPNAGNTIIVGEDAIYTDNNGYDFDLTYNNLVRGYPDRITWRVESEDGGDSFVTLTDNGNSCNIKVGNVVDSGGNVVTPFESLYYINVCADLDNPNSETDVTIKKTIIISPQEGIIISPSSNPKLWEALQRGLVTDFDAYNKKAFTKTDAQLTFDSGFNSRLLYTTTQGVDADGDLITIYNGVETFNELQYFTSLSSEASIDMFYNNRAIKEVTLPTTWTTVPSGCFYNCEKLETVRLAATTSDVTIEADAFHNCGALVNVDLGSTIASINNSAFYGCIKLKSLLTTDRLTYIGINAFYNCTALESFNFTDNITYIGSYGFYNCTSLKTATLPANDNYKIVEQGTFWFCRNLTEVTIPNNVLTLDSNCFASTGLQSFNLNKVETINRQAFYGSDLQTIYIPSSVKFIGENVFGGNTRLISFTGDSIYNPVSYSETGLSSNYLVCDPITTTLGNGTQNTTYTLLCCAPGVSEFSFPRDVTKIGDYAFYVNMNLKSIDIPDYITSIGTNAFYSCTQLESVVLPLQTTVIPNSCFGYCTKLTSIYVRSVDNTNPGFNDLSSVKTLEWGAFYNASALTELYFKDLNYVADSTFYRCVQLVEITVDNATPPDIASSSTNVFGTNSSWSTSYTTTVGGESTADKYLFVPSGSGTSYRNTRWYDLISVDGCGFTLSETL